MWGDYLTNAGTWLDVTAVQAGVILSLAVTLAVLVAILIATRGRKAEFTVPTGALFLTVAFTYMGWYPIWTGSVLSLVLAIFVGKIISGGF
jgi:hypothetical protein